MSRVAILWSGFFMWAGAVWAQWGEPVNLRNAPFEAATAGWPGVTVLDVVDPGDPVEVGQRLHALGAHRARGPLPLPYWFRFLQQHGVIAPGARPWSVRTVVLRSRGSLVLPNLVRWRQGRQGPPGQGGELTLVLDDSWSTLQKQELSRFLEKIQPILTDLYGPPAFPDTVTIVHDPDLTNPTGFDTAIYDVSTKTIRLRLLNDEEGGVPQATPFDPDDFYILTFTLLLAYHGELRLAYSAWEEGFARAAQLLAIFRWNPDFDLRDPGYVLPIYEGLNQPTLGVPTFDLTNTSPLLRQVRGGMAQAAWYKVFAENHSFFKEFNRRYYAQYDPGQSITLAGDTVRLRAIAREIVPDLEGLPFDDWYRRQFILDTSLHAGPKLYTFHSPKGRTAILVIYYFVTLADGGEAALTGTVRLRYLAWDGFDISHMPEEGNQVEIGHFGDPGIANIAPTFFNIGGDQRVLLEINIQGHQTSLYFPYFDREDNTDLGDLFGLVTEGDQGVLTVEVEGLAPVEAQVNRGVFSLDLPGELVTSNKVGFRFQPSGAGSPATVQRRNTGLQFYVPLLATREQTGQTIAHTFPAGTRMVGFPLRTASDYAPAMLGLHPHRVLLARWDPEVEGKGIYLLFPDTPPLQPGLGYWLKTASPLSISVEGRPVSTESDFRLRLPQGWNQVANPFRDFPVALSDVKVQWKEEGPLAWPQAVREGWVAAPLWDYEPGQGYRTATRLEPWQGYWMRVFAPEGVTLFVPPTAATGRGLTGDEPEHGWRVRLVAESAGRQDAVNYLGMARGAANGWDALDWPQPPEPQGFLSLGFAEDQWGHRSGLYAADIRSPARRATWTVEVASDSSQEPVRIRWEGLRALPADLALFWEDPETGRSWSMRQVNSVTLPGQPDLRPRRFRVRLEPRSERPLVVQGLRAEPARGRGSLAVRFGLSQPAQLWVTVRRAGGQVVRELVRGETRSAGEQRWSWDGRDASGRALPAGVYLLEVRARDESGHEVRALTLAPRP